MIELHLFGYPSVWLNGEQITGFISEKALALFIYVAETGETHARDFLTGLLWGDTDEKRARASLRSALYNIGKILPDALDVTRKTVALVAETHSDTTQLRQQNDPSVYTADFLAGFYIPDSAEFEEWQLRQREQLRQLAVNAWRARAESAESTSDNHAAIKAWRELTKLEPWREEPHRHIMRLHARNGDYAAALRQFTICAAQLKEELGIEPMAQTVALAEQIKAARSQPRDNLRAENEPFFGRSALLADLKNRIPTQRLITLTGIGGSGKSRLALTTGRAFTHHFLNGVAFVPLAEVATEEPRRAVVTAIIAALTQAGMLPTEELSHPETWLIDQLAKREMLLILDNFEHLLEAALLLDRILQETKHIHLLVTSRERLQLRQEQVVTLGGLHYVGQPIAQTPSGQLFLTAAQRIGADISDLAAVAQICELVDGLPLALEMAAAWTDMESPATIADTLATDLDLLQSDERNRPNRQRSMRAVFDYSWRHLSARERNCLRKLSVLYGVFSADAAQTITQANRRTLVHLVNKSLVQATGKGNFRLHPLLRQFSAEKLTSDEQETRQRHFDYFRDWLKTYYGGADTSPLDVTQDAQVDFENLRAAWRFAIAEQDVDVLTKMLPDLARLVSRHHRYTSFDEMLRQAQPLFSADTSDASPARREAWARFLTMDGLANLRNNRVWAAHNRAIEAWRVLDALEQSDEEVKRKQAATANLLCITCKVRGEFEQAIEYGLKSIALHEEVDDQVGIVRPLSNLGATYVLVQQFEHAAAMFERGLAVCRASDNIDGTIHLSNNLGVMYFDRGDYEKAQQHYQAALKEAQKWNRPIPYMLLNINLAEVAVMQGRFADALPFCETAGNTLQETGEVRIGLELFPIWARALLGLGDVDTAAVKVSEGLQHARKIDSVNNPLRVLLGAGMVLKAQNHPHAALVFGYVSNHAGAAKLVRESAEAELKTLTPQPIPDMPLIEFIEQTLTHLTP